MAKLIPDRETLTVEFKSDRDRLPDRELVAAVVCLANTEGGDLYVGVEDDGTVSGLHAAHGNVTGLTALIANSSVTSPRGWWSARPSRCRPSRICAPCFWIFSAGRWATWLK